MRRAGVFTVVLLLGPVSACMGADSPNDGSRVEIDQTPPQVASLAAPRPPTGAWVRVSQQRLLSAPSHDARLEVESKQAFRIAEVVGVEGEFVKLRSLAVDPQALCATTSGADSNFELHFFAPLDALEFVLTMPKVVEFDDSTKLELAAGVPINMAGPKPKLEVAEGVGFVVPLIADEIGRWFPATTQVPAEPSYRWSRAQPLHYGDQSFEFYDPPFAEPHEQQLILEGGLLLTFVDACGRFTLRIEGDEKLPERESSGLDEKKGPEDIPQMRRDRRVLGVGPLTPEEFEQLFGEGECDPFWYVPAGAELMWPDSGSVAGAARTGVPLPEEQEREGKVCFTAAEMRVCVATDKLERKVDPDCLP
jgi:hypothetical protein